MLMLNGVSMACFYDKAVRKVYVEIDEGDREPGEEDIVGELQYSMYGTRGAAPNRQDELSKMCESIGFHAGK